MVDEDAYVPEPDELDEADLVAPGRLASEARLAGDEAVAALARVTAHLVGGEQRPEQQEMCRAVAEALVSRNHLAVQAGTGTGKSLAYLVPAALSGRKVVVATATKALQDQLAEKDMPQVAAGLGVPLDFAVLKGRSNYICLQRVAEVGTGGIQGELGDAVGGDGDRVAADGEERGAGVTPATAVRALRLPKASSTRCARCWPGRRRRRPETGETSPSSRATGPGTW